MRNKFWLALLLFPWGLAGCGLIGYCVGLW